MKRKTIVLLLACALLLSACGSAPKSAEPAVPVWTVQIVDGSSGDALAEVKVTDGGKLALPELAKENYLVEGYYATPALKAPFDLEQEIHADTSVFVAWKSSVEDTRPWMVAGSLRGYPENEWGKIWPQDDFRLKKVDGAFNTFELTLNLYEGDAFKIAVIGEGYAWDTENSLDSRHLADKSEDALLFGGENAFDSGANIEVKEDGQYRLILTTDAETLSLCSLAYERLGDADELGEIVYDMKLWASFNDWQGQDMLRSGDDLLWTCEADVPAEGGEFGVLNAATGDWYSSENNTQNIKLEEGHYRFSIELELVDGKPQLKGEITAVPTE